jgi:hypothetical protein
VFGIEMKLDGCTDILMSADSWNVNVDVEWIVSQYNTQTKPKIALKLLLSSVHFPPLNHPEKYSYLHLNMADRFPSLEDFDEGRFNECNTFALTILSRPS